MDLREISAPHLRLLSDETGLHGQPRRSWMAPTSFYIDALPDGQPRQREIDLNLHVGARLPAYCTAMGKAILALLPRGPAREVIEQHQTSHQRGPNTLTESEGVPHGAAHDPRSRASPVNDEELAYGLRSIAAPIRCRRGECSRLSTSPSTARWSPWTSCLRASDGGHPVGARHLAQHGPQVALWGSRPGRAAPAASVAESERLALDDAVAIDVHAHVEMSAAGRRLAARRAARGGACSTSARRVGAADGGRARAVLPRARTWPPSSSRSTGSRAAASRRSRTRRSPRRAAANADVLIPFASVDPRATRRASTRARRADRRARRQGASSSTRTLQALLPERPRWRTRSTR